VSVTATCLNCGDQHPLGVRDERTVGATACPSCGSPCYESTPNGDRPAAHEVRAAVLDVRGVGDTTFRRLGRAFEWERLPYEPHEALLTVDGIGTEVAERIDDATNGLLNDTNDV